METKNTPNRYSDKDLEEFKRVILVKLDMAKEEFQSLTDSLSYSNPNGTDDTSIKLSRLRAR